MNSDPTLNKLIQKYQETHGQAPSEPELKTDNELTKFENSLQNKSIHELNNLIHEQQTKLQQLQSSSQIHPQIELSHIIQTLQQVNFALQQQPNNIQLQQLHNQILVSKNLVENKVNELNLLFQCINIISKVITEKNIIDPNKNENNNGFFVTNINANAAEYIPGASFNANTQPFIPSAYQGDDDNYLESIVQQQTEEEIKQNEIIASSSTLKVPVNDFVPSWEPQPLDQNHNVIQNEVISNNVETTKASSIQITLTNMTNEYQNTELEISTSTDFDTFLNDVINLYNFTDHQISSLSFLTSDYQPLTEINFPTILEESITIIYFGFIPCTPELKSVVLDHDVLTAELHSNENILEFQLKEDEVESDIIEFENNNNETFRLNDLFPEKTYAVRIRNKNYFGCSNWTPFVEANDIGLSLEKLPSTSTIEDNDNGLTLEKQPSTSTIGSKFSNFMSPNAKDGFSSSFLGDIHRKLAEKNVYHTESDSEEDERYIPSDKRDVISGAQTKYHNAIEYDVSLLIKCSKLAKQNDFKELIAKDKNKDNIRQIMNFNKNELHKLLNRLIPKIKSAGTLKFDDEMMHNPTFVRGENVRVKRIQSTKLSQKSKPEGYGIVMQHLLTDERKMEKKVTGLLNRITPEKFDALANKMLELIDEMADTKHKFEIALSGILTKAATEPLFAEQYAKLCEHLSNHLPVIISQFNWVQTELDKQKKQKNSQKKQLTGLFSTMMLSSLNAKYDEAHRDARNLNFNKLRKDIRYKDKDDDDIHNLLNKKKKIFLGMNIITGELYSRKLINEKIIFKGILPELVSSKKEPTEIDIEACCKLFETCGGYMDKEKSKSQITNLLNLLKKQSRKCSFRIQVLVDEIIKLRSKKWIGRKKETAKKIAEIHDEFHEEKQQINERKDFNNDTMYGGSSRQLLRGKPKHSPKKMSRYEQVSTGSNGKQYRKKPVGSKSMIDLKSPTKVKKILKKNNTIKSITPKSETKNDSKSVSSLVQSWIKEYISTKDYDDIKQSWQNHELEINKLIYNGETTYKWVNDLFFNQKPDDVIIIIDLISKLIKDKLIKMEDNVINYLIEQWSKEADDNSLDVPKYFNYISQFIACLVSCDVINIQKIQTFIDKYEKNSTKPSGIIMDKSITKIACHIVGYLIDYKCNNIDQIKSMVSSHIDDKALEFHPRSNEVTKYLK